MSAYGGGPAFPPSLTYGDGGLITSHDFVDGAGMSLRDYFAGQALPAVIAAYVEANGRCIGTDHVVSNCVAHAYRFADAMLARRDTTTVKELPL